MLSTLPTLCCMTREGIMIYILYLHQIEPHRESKIVPTPTLILQVFRINLVPSPSQTFFIEEPLLWEPTLWGGSTSATTVISLSCSVRETVIHLIQKGNLHVFCSAKQILILRVYEVNSWPLHSARPISFMFHVMLPLYGSISLSRSLFPPRGAILVEVLTPPSCSHYPDSVSHMTSALAFCCWTRCLATVSLSS